MALKDLWKYYKPIAQTVRKDVSKVGDYFGVNKPGLGTFGNEINQHITRPIQRTIQNEQKGAQIAENYIKRNPTLNKIYRPLNMLRKTVPALNPVGTIKSVASIAQDIPRMGYATGLSLVKGAEEFKPKGYKKLIFGNDSVKPIQQGTISQGLQKIGVSQRKANIAGGAGLALGLVSNITPMGAGKSKLAKTLTKIDDINEVKKLTKGLNLGDDVLDVIRKSKNVDEIDNLLKAKTILRKGETSSLHRGAEVSPPAKTGIKPNKPLEQAPLSPESKLNSSVSFDSNITPKNKPVNMIEGQKPTLALSEGTIRTSNKKEYIKLKTQGRPVEYVQKPGQKAINLTSEARLLNPETSKAEVQANLQSKFDDFERGLYGSATSELQGGKKGAGLIARVTRPLQEKTSSLVGKGLESQNTLIRGISRGIRGLFGGSGNTAEITARLGGYRGGVQSAENLSNDFMKLGETLLPDKLSREKVWAFLDPELSGIKVSESDLLPHELEALKTLRQASNLINDTNYSMGKISHETWLQGRGGKYITRAYQDYDLPPELSEAFSGGRGKLDLGGYKQRTEVNDWKQENAIKDPFYLASKRIQSTFQNKAITDYSSWISKQQGLVSDVEKAGYTQLSDSPMWGELSGKFVRKDILEGIRGFYFDNKALQGAYDALNWYDRNPVRQALKKTKTVYNPATRLGNQTSNRIFAIFNGINPLSFEKNIQTFAKAELKNNGQYARLLRQKGVLGNDMTKYELVKNLAKEGADPGTLRKIDNYISDTYGAADEQAKLAAFKYWLDKGKTIDEAILKVRNGFQDYSKVGLYYDVMAKVPLIGKPFIRFQSELARIIKNTALENPLGLATVVGSIALIGHYASKLSGESPEDKQTREERFGVPVIPFTQIPLVFQTPYGEINVARMFGMYETAGADTKNKNIVQRSSKYLPIDIPTSKEDILKSMSNDVMTGGITSLITDTDFRGKSIADPNQNKYQPTTLTPTEQNINRLKYAGYNYNLPFVNDLINIGQAAKGKPDQYGNKKTVKQAVVKLTGVKINQFGHTEAEAQRAKNAEFEQYDKDNKAKKINQINKQLLNGEISEETANKRIKNIGGGVVSSGKGENKITYNSISGKYQFIDKNGDLSGFDTKEEAKLEIEKDKMKKPGDYKIVGDAIVFYNSKTKKPDTKDYAQFNEEVYNAQYTLDKQNYKNAEDYASYKELEKKRFQYLQEKIDNADPFIDQANIIKWRNDQGDILQNIEKYESYGGAFTKYGKGSKASKLKKIKIKNEKVSVKKFTVQKRARKKLAVKKAKVNAFI